MNISEYKTYMAHLNRTEAEALVRQTRLTPKEERLALIVDVHSGGMKAAAQAVCADRRTLDKILARAREKIIRQTIKEGVRAGILLLPV